MILTDPHNIVTRFNNYFTNIGPSLAKNIPVVDNNPNDYLKNRVEDTIFLKPLEEEELKEVISNLHKYPRLG